MRWSALPWSLLLRYNGRWPVSSTGHVVQVDNPDPDAHYPVVLAAPAAAQRLAILPSALDARPVAGGGAQALALRAAMWRRRPAGVRCVERIEVGMTYIVTP